MNIATDIDWDINNDKVCISLFLKEIHTLSLSISVVILILLTRDIISFTDFISKSKNSNTLTSNASAILESCSSLGFLL